jgi:hypothetical protein
MIETDRLIAPAAVSPVEEQIERALRPRTLAEYVGQAKAREQLEIFISAARNRSEALDHVLLFGPPGWARPRWRTSSRAKWASTCARPRARCWSAPATSRPC